MSYQQTVNIDYSAQGAMGAIGVEATARQSADNSLSALITAEQTARLAEVDVERQRIDTLLEGTGVDLDQLKELIAAYASADTSLQDQITAINTNITAIQAQLTVTDATLNTLLANITPMAPEPDPVHIFTKTTLVTGPGGVPGGSAATIITSHLALPSGEYYYRQAGTGVNIILKSLSDSLSYVLADVYQVLGSDWNDPAKFPDGPQDYA